jgi:hypothetical protein
VHLEGVAEHVGFVARTLLEALVKCTVVVCFTSVFVSEKRPGDRIETQDDLQSMSWSRYSG